MRYSPVVEQDFELSKMADYKRFLKRLGSNITFESDKWVCDKLVRSPAEVSSSVTLWFSAVPVYFKEMAKVYCIVNFVNGNGVKSVALNLVSITNYIRFLHESHHNTQHFDVSRAAAIQYYHWLNESEYAEATKASLWYGMSKFCRKMRKWDDGFAHNPFSENPFSRYLKKEYKYIPEDIVRQLDSAFQDADVLPHIRCIYWIMRLIPSRINEVLGMKINCLKPYNGHYCLFIPTWKQNGGYFEPELRVIHIEDTGIAANLLSLVRQQQQTAITFQSRLAETQKGYLFVFQRGYQRKCGRIDYCDEYMAANATHVKGRFLQVCERHNVLDENGDVFRFTSHQLRHNGITDRLAAGFTPEQIRFMTAQHGDAMILKAYNHLDLLPEVITEKQNYILSEPRDINNDQVLFCGRILNMDEQLEKRLLRNIRAHRVLGGICSDITGCRSNMFLCLSCEHFVPDVDQYEFFIQQVATWNQKAIAFKDFPLIRKHATENAELFHSIVIKITNIIGGCTDE